jgi:pSer/pThr/pTyr-binding forkhead associated (FHA) protein
MQPTIQPMAKLVVLSEGFTGVTCELKADKTTIGRVEDNAFQISESSVSSHHCEVVKQGGDLLIKDLQSTNGTFINGEQITEAVLKPGQILRLGQIELRFESGVAGAAAASKKLEKTMVIPQGVKIQELDQANRPAVETAKGFSKKSNKTNLIFIVGGIALGLIIVISLVIALTKIGH